MSRIHEVVSGCNNPVAVFSGFRARFVPRKERAHCSRTCFQHLRPACPSGPGRTEGGNWWNFYSKKRNYGGLVRDSDITCSLENYLLLPDHTMDGRIAAAREKLGSSTILLGHHYQRDEVIRFADFTGDSYKLSKAAAETDARYIVFCGVHFMAESADVLGRDGQQVILPDLNAGCSMADMAEISQVEACWEALRAPSAYRRDDSHHLYELHRRHQGILRGAGRTGVHLVKCALGI